MTTIMTVVTCMQVGRVLRGKLLHLTAVTALMEKQSVLRGLTISLFTLMQLMTSIVVNVSMYLV